MLEYIYKSIYTFLFTKHVIDDNYKSAFHVVSNPKYHIWLNAEGTDPEKKSNCLKELKYYLENIKTISNYILLDDPQEAGRQKLLDSLKSEISTASILAHILEHDPNKYDTLVSKAKQYGSAYQENHKTTIEEQDYNQYHHDTHNTEYTHYDEEITIEAYE